MTHGPVRIYAHSQGVLAFATDTAGHVLASGDGAGNVRLWHFRSERIVAEMQATGPIWSIAVAETRRQVAFSDTDGQIFSWSPDAELTTRRMQTGSRRILSMRYLSNGDLRWAGLEGDVRQLSSADEIESFMHSIARRIKVADFAAGGRWVALVDDENVLSVLDWTNEKSVREIRRSRSALNSVAFNASGSLLASGGGDGLVRIHRLEGSQPEFVLRGHRDTVVCVCFNPDGSMLASGDASGLVRLWDTADLCSLLSFVLPGRTSAEAIAFGLRGAVIVAGGTGSEVYCRPLTDLTYTGR